MRPNKNLKLFCDLSQTELQQLSFTVKQRKPQTIREVVKAVIEFKFHIMMNNSKISSDQSKDPSNKLPANYHQPLHQLQWLTDTLQNLQRSLADLESRALKQLTSLLPIPMRWSKCPLTHTRKVPKVIL